MSEITDMTLEEALGEKWRPGVHYVSQAEVRMDIMKGEIARIAGQRDELLVALKLAHAFITDCITAGGPYPYINGKGIVSDAYRVSAGNDAVIARIEAEKAGVPR